MDKPYCIKNDINDESDCTFAKIDLSGWKPMCRCTHFCVNELVRQLTIEKEARASAEAKLEKYREAINPFVKNCRAVIAVVDAKEGEGK